MADSPSLLHAAEPIEYEDKKRPKPHDLPTTATFNKKVELELQDQILNQLAIQFIRGE